MKCPKQLLVTISLAECGPLSGFSWFKCAETSVEGCEHCGYPSAGHAGENVEQV
jgi:hypothetical protein